MAVLDSGMLGKTVQQKGVREYPIPSLEIQSLHGICGCSCSGICWPGDPDWRSNMADLACEQSDRTMRMLALLSQHERTVAGQRQAELLQNFPAY